MTEPEKIVSVLPLTGSQNPTNDIQEQKDPLVLLAQALKKASAEFETKKQTKASDDADSDDATTTKDSETNILLLLSKVFCSSMDIGNYDELTNTKIVQTNQDILAAQQEQYKTLSDQSTTKAASTTGQLWTFWGIFAAVIVGVAVIALTVATAGAAGIFGVTAASTAAASTAAAGVATAAGMISVGTCMGAAIGSSWGTILLLAAGAGAAVAFLPKMLGSDDFAPHGETPDENELEKVQTQTQEVGTITSRANNNIQTESQRISNVSEFCTQMANYIRTAIQDFGQTCKIQYRG